MNPMTEPEMPARVTRYIEALRIIKPTRVPVSRRDRNRDTLTCTNYSAIDLDILARDPRERRPNQREIAHELINRPLHQRRIILQGVQLVRMTKQREHAVRDHPDHCVMARAREIHSLTYRLIGT